MQFGRAVQALCDAGVEFVVIGGVSASLNGSSYITNDSDICYSRSRENLKRLANALAPFHPRLREAPANLPFVWDEATPKNGTVFTLSTDFGIINLMAEAIGLGDFEEVKRGSVLTRAFDRDVYTLDLPSLIRSKRAAGRVKDLLVLPELEGLLEAREPE
ncbi:MAG TPA: hypothetical protein VH639_15040 [Bryobacteraceae bacterium]|jgi:hypothetical protein